MGHVETFVRLFRGRGDARGTWAGGSVRERLTPYMFERHLFSHDPTEWIGVYNVIDTRCSWGCVDMDVPALGTMVRVRHALRDAHIPSWIERTTRGYHLWTFPFDGLVDATVMRQALTAACIAADYQAKEIFPKQTSVSGLSLGNYVRLPMNGGLSNPAPGDCRRFIHEGVSLHDMDLDRATTPDLISLAETAPPLPQVVDTVVDTQRGLEVQWEIERIGGAAYRVWRDGPQFGHDRSSTLSRLAHRCAEQDVPPNLALAIVSSADQRWGKFSDRADGMVHLRNIVSRVYGARESA